MNLTRDQKIRLSLFWITGTVLTVIIFAAALGSRLFEERDIFYIEYVNQPVSGLQVGSSVKYQGIQIGRVDDIRFDEDEPSRVIVVLSLKKGTPIKSDVEAQLAMVGITGMRQVELIGGSRHAETLEPGSYIPPGMSIFDHITGDVQVITRKLEILLNNVNALTGPDNQQKFRRILANLDNILEEGKEPFSSAVARSEDIIENIYRLSESSVLLSERIARITTAEDFEQSFDSFYESIKNIQYLSSRIRNIADSPDIDEIIKNLSGVPVNQIGDDIARLIEQFNHSFTRMDLTLVRTSREILISMDLLNEILEDLNEFSRRISEDPSSLIRF